MQENESDGVEHCWGNVMMVLGGHVNFTVHGSWPGLSDAALTDGDLTATTDYRAVLADILVNRGASTSQVQQVFPDDSGRGLCGPCQAATSSPLARSTTRRRISSRVARAPTSVRPNGPTCAQSAYLWPG